LNADEIFGDAPIKVRVLAEASYTPDPAFEKSPPVKMLPLLPFNVPLEPVAPIVIVPAQDSVPALTFRVADVPDVPKLTGPFTLKAKLERLSAPVDNVNEPQEASPASIGFEGPSGISTGSSDVGTPGGDQLFALLQSVAPPASPPTQVRAVCPLATSCIIATRNIAAKMRIDFFISLPFHAVNGLRMVMKVIGESGRRKTGLF
jgi:hypothetical protein